MAYAQCTPKITYQVYEITEGGLLKRPKDTPYYGDDHILYGDYESPEAVLNAAKNSGRNFDFTEYAIIPHLSFSYGEPE